MNQVDIKNKKAELIQTVKKSDSLWYDQNEKSLSLEYLRKGISIIHSIIKNEKNYQTKQFYMAKQNQFKCRLLERQSQKCLQQCSTEIGDGQNSYQKQKPKLIELLTYSEKLWYEKDTTQLSIKYLRKAIQIIDDLLQHEQIDLKKQFLINRLNQNNTLLEKRLKDPNLAINGHCDYHFKADMLYTKDQLIQKLKNSESLWSEGRKQQSLQYLRKAVYIIDFIIQNERNDKLKHDLITKKKQLKTRLQQRQLQMKK